MRVRHLLIGLALRLGFAPFTWLMRAFETLAIRCSVRSVRKVPGVAAIYLAGSRARHEAIPGLSDIDFKIFVCGPRNRATSDEIRRRFARLRACFPMLGPPDEKGIHFIEGFAAEHARYPLLRHLFDSRFYRHRLLWGEPWLERLVPPQPGGPGSGQALVWRLKDWVEKASVLAEHPVLAPPQRRYLLYKAVADVGLVLLVAGDGERQNPGRPDVLRELGARLDDGARDTLAQLLAERASRFRRRRAQPDQVWQLFLRLVGESLVALGVASARQLSLPASGQLATTEIPSWLRAALPADARVAEVPWRRIPISPLDCGYFGRRLLLVAPARPLSLTEQVRLRTAARPHADTTPVMIHEAGWLRSAWCDLLDHWLSPEAGDDLTAFLAAAEHPPARLAQHLRAKLLLWQDELVEILSSQELARMDRSRYLRLVFAALAGLAFCRALDQDAGSYPSDAREVADWLRSQTPLHPGFIALLEEEWHRVQDMGLPFREALFPKTRLLLRTCAGLVREGEPLAGLAQLNAIPDLARLTVSVVVPTRNRCTQLARCLHSLAHQERSPDELLVVDNASSDDTAGTVARLQASFPVRLVRESVVGVAPARNRGLREARGEVVAFIDDDAVAEPGWLAAVEGAFLADERIGIVGGSVFNLDTGATDPVSRFFELVERLPA